MSTPLFTQLLTIGPNGQLRIGAIGGSPDLKTEMGTQQVGQGLPPRVGTISVTSSDPVGLRACTVTVEGYYGRTYGPSPCPVEIITELPASVIVQGPPGLQLCFQAFVCPPYDERGARLSVVKPVGAPITAPVPSWARSFDYTGGASATFRDDAGATVGVIGAIVSNFTIPDRAATVELTGSDFSFLVFRQKG